MKGARLNILIAAIVLCAIAIIIFTQFELKLVKDEDWKENYNPKSNKNYGLAVFEELLQKKLGNENVIIDYNLKLNTLQDSNIAIVIFYSDLDHMSYSGINEYDALLEKGNDLYLFSNQLDFVHNEVYFKNDTSMKPSKLDTFIRQDGRKIAFDFQLFNIDSTYLQNLNFIKVVNADYSQDEGEKPYEVSTEEDNSEEVINEEKDSTNEEVSEAVAEDTFTVEASVEEIEEDSTSFNIAKRIDTLLMFHGKPIFQKVETYNGHVYTHTFPVLLTNIVSKNAQGYAEHFNILLKELQGKKVIITSANLTGTKDNPLEVLLRNKALALAYYTILFSLLLYLIFGSKRLQRPIPITEPVKNTSLEYVQTLARLYELQGQNYKLVSKMSENFYHMIAKKYYISKDDENFVQHLSKKSKIKEDLLNAAIQYFNQIEKNAACSDEQLQMLNIYLSKIENHIKHGNNQ